MTTLSILPSSPPDRSSFIHIGHGIIADVKGQLGADGREAVAYWIWDQTVWDLWRKRAGDLSWPGASSRRHLCFSATERNKRISSVEALARELVQRGADRSSVLVAVGGGITGDVVGFLASIYMRGIPHYQIPTTLLAQVDSSIGGKTGVDLPEGKNLIGTFHQPERVWMDPQWLSTLPPEQIRQGMAEVIKTAMLGDARLWDFLEKHHDDLKRADTDTLTTVITACCQVKAAVVQADEREAGLRRILNLGHTVGHALERLSDYSIAHGDAVAMGMIAAAAWAVRLGLLESSIFERLRNLCAHWELPVALPAQYSADSILRALTTDKKRRGGKMHVILPTGIGQVVDRCDLDFAELADVLDALRG